MNLSRTKIASLAAIPAIVCVAASVLHTRRMAAVSMPRVDTRTRAAERVPIDPQQSAKTIQCFADRVGRDPQSAINNNLLAAAYLQRCRETGDIADAQRAEACARRSLRIRRANNRAGYDELARSLFTQHRFPEAMTLAAAIAKAAHDDPQALSTLVELETETGRYDAAARDLLALQAQPNTEGPYTDALSARLDEMRGALDRSQRLLEAAADKADESTDLPRENVAWFHFRVGNIRAERGDAAGATQAYYDALAWYPSDQKTMLGLAKLEAGENHWRQAIDWATRSAAIVPTPETIALLVDCCAASGDAARAAENRLVIEAMRSLSRAQGTVYDRQRALYCADHDVHLDEALSLARRELTVRKDVYAYDTLAWVCCRCGRLAEARDASAKAIATGSQDAILFYHRGLIDAAMHDDAGARMNLTKALSLNPYFHPTGPRIAREMLQRLDNRHAGGSYYE